MSFADGMRFGANAYNQGQDRQRQERLDAIAAEEQGLRMRGLRRTQDQADRVDTALQDYQTLSDRDGMTPGLEAQVGRTYGMSPQQIATAGTGLQSKLNSYDTPDSADLQSTPAWNVNPGVDTELGRKRGLLKARQKVDVARGDTNAMAAREAEGQGLDLQADFKANMKRIQDPEFQAELRKSVNTRSGNVTIVKAPTDAKGRRTGPSSLVIVGADGEEQTVRLSNDDMLQLAHARTLAERGMVQESIAMLGGVNKDLAAAVQRDNETRTKTFDSNTRAQGEFDQNQHRASVLAETGRHNKAVEGNAAGARRDAATARDKPIQLVNTKTGEAALFRESRLQYDKNGMLVLPAGFTFPNQRTGGGAGNARYEADSIWAEAEKKLMSDNMPPDQIAVQREEFLARRGFAPQAAVQALLEGRDSKTGKQYGPEVLAAFKQRFPHTPIDEAQLPPWLGGLPGGLPGARRSTPVDRIGAQQIIGPLTPLSMIEEAAAAGNPRARAWMQRSAQDRAERPPVDDATLMSGY